MDNLTYELRALCRRNRDGSHATQANRMGILTLISCQLIEAGFRRMRLTSLKGKHVEPLLERWQAEGLSPATIKNRVAALCAGGRRRWATQGQFPRTMRPLGSLIAGSSPTTTRRSNSAAVLSASPIRTCG